MKVALAKSRSCCLLEVCVQSLRLSIVAVQDTASIALTEAVIGFGLTKRPVKDTHVQSC